MPSVIFIDARPNQIKSARGATKYKRKGTVVVTNMNPFIYDYQSNVAEKPFSDAAILSFLKLAIPGAEAFIKEVAPARASFSYDPPGVTRRSIDALIDATSTPPAAVPAQCANGAHALEALLYLHGLRNKLVHYYYGSTTTGTGA